MFKLVNGILLALLAFFVFQVVPARAQGGANIGSLQCRLAPSVGLILGSRQRMDCRFYSSRGYVERYAGTISRIGIDLGFTKGGRMIWAVFANTQSPKRGALAGNFVGASGDIAFIFGVGANALVGGSNRSIMLQPVSVSGQVGVNLAVGVAGLQLRYRR